MTAPLRPGASAPLLRQFSGTIETVALLLDKNIEYPPRVKRYEVKYDWHKKMSKVSVTAGEEWDEYIMRYDQAKHRCHSFGSRFPFIVLFCAPFYCCAAFPKLFPLPWCRTWSTT